MSFGRFWNKSAAKFPVLTLSVTNGVLAGSGNFLAQSILLYQDSKESNSTEASSKGYKYTEMMRFFAYGFMFAPISFRWVKYLDKRFPFKQATSALNGTKSAASISHSLLKTKKDAAFWRTVGKRVAFDQTLFAPPAVAAFIIGMGFLEYKDLSEIKSDLKETYFSNMIAGYFLWPAVQTITFSVIPLIYRVPFIGVANLVWNCTLSLLRSGSVKMEII